MEVISALLVDEIKKHPDGRVDLLGLFEDIYVESVPFILDNLSLFVDLEIGPEDRGRRHAMEVHLLDEDGAPVQPARVIKFDMPGADDYPRSTAQLDLIFPNVTFRRFGVHHLDIVFDGRRARRVYLSVQRANTEANHDAHH